MFGLDVDTIRTIREVIGHINPIQKVLLYGSRAMGNYKTGSDIDITLLGHNLTLDNSVYPLMRKLDDLSLPYGFDISIFKELNDLNLVEHILQVGKVFYQRNSKAPWPMVELGEVLKLEYGRPLSQENRISNGKFPVYGANGIKSRSNKYLCGHKSIILGRKGSAGEINLTSEKFWPLDVTYYTTFDSSKYDLEFLYHSMKTLNLKKLAKGVKPGINRNDVYSLKVNIPSRNTQKKIVTALDRASTTVDKAIAHTERALQNCRELFDSYTSQLLSNDNGQWPMEELKNVCKYFEDGDWIESKDQSSEGVRLIQTGNIGLGIFKNREEKARFISTKTFQRLRCKEIFENDCLISRLPRPVGRCCFIPKSSERMITAVDCTIVRIDEKIITPNFFKYYLQSDKYLRDIEEETTGTTRKRISRKKLGEILIPLPTLNTQKKIVSKIDKIKREHDRLIEIYQKKLDCLQELKRAIFQQVLNGEMANEKASL